MSRLNGIITASKVYTLGEEDSCCHCAFSEYSEQCQRYNSLCGLSVFRLSQTLDYEFSKLKAIVVAGKVYEAIGSKDKNCCISCDLQELCVPALYALDCYKFIGHKTFKFSQLLTDKLNEK